jgi:hypothetical protein
MSSKKENDFLTLLKRLHAIHSLELQVSLLASIKKIFSHRLLQQDQLT